MKKRMTRRYRQILQAANFFCRLNGVTNTGIAHASEKLSGERLLTWEDLDTIQTIIPADPHLLSYWHSALCAIPVSLTITLEDGEPRASAVLPAPHPPLFPSPAGVMRRAA